MVLNTTAELSCNPPNIKMPLSFSRTRLLQLISKTPAHHLGHSKANQATSYDGHSMEEIWNPALPIQLPSPGSVRSKRDSDWYSLATNLLTISKTFHTELVPAADALLFSSDGVFFCVHLETIHRHCPEAFRSFLDESSNSQLANPIMLDCPSEELNIILHALYDMSLDAYRPSPDTIATAIDIMPRLGVTVNRVVYPGCALYEYILTYTPIRPLEVYAMAAHHDVHSLAVYASAYLLNMEILSVSEDASTRMGPLYFLKLVRLHMARSDALKASLLVAPPAHPPAMVDRCTFGQQQQARQVRFRRASYGGDTPSHDGRYQLHRMQDDATKNGRPRQIAMVIRAVTCGRHMDMMINSKIHVAVTTAPRSTPECGGTYKVRKATVMDWSLRQT
ncbi:hypothetical protein D9619_004686 [Psilocybe cf. subviscida]|uniref:BTB domain-containing protein n=1 Tax=Psilocybe cf. subviscida TaxID=2480587 RepID=A0A8H5F7K2_9AGAR|nr:hypothetical protein D9619_004686 [Psilocybe cf. subviscida]